MIKKIQEDLKRNLAIAGHREVFSFTTWESSCCFYFCWASCSPFTELAQAVWSCRTPIFHRVIRVKEPGLGHHGHGHSVSSRFSAETQRAPPWPPPQSQSEEAIVCGLPVSYYCKCQCNSSTHRHYVNRKTHWWCLQTPDQEQRGRSRCCRRPRGKLRDNQNTLTLCAGAAVTANTNI